MPSLVYAADTNDDIDCGSAADWDDLAAVTYCAWVEHLNDVAFRRIIAKGNDIKDWMLRSTHEMFFRQNCATTSAITEGTRVISANVPVFLAVTYDTTGKVAKLFNGDLNTAVTEETTYVQQITGVGAESSDAGNSLHLGAREHATALRSFGGQFYFGAVFNASLTAAQLQEYQFYLGPHSNLIGLWWPGLDGTTSVPDYSGSGHDGTASGLTLSTGSQMIGSLFGHNSGFSDEDLVAAAGGFQPAWARGANTVLGAVN